MKFISLSVLLFSFASCSTLNKLSNREKIQEPRTIEEIISGTETFSKNDSLKELESVRIVSDRKNVSSEKKNFLSQTIKKTESVSVRNDSEEEVHSSQLDLNYKKKHYNFWVNYFTKREKARFQRHMLNGDKYSKLVRSIIRSHNLPEDLYYVGLIESGYNTHIRSHASAVGPWQFIKGTATRYGMRVDRYVDERRNVIKSTHAAAKYFKDLYNIFGSWELALCAYNAGEYRIINAIRKGNTRDYRKLVQKNLIPKETIYYIPKVAAAIYLDENRRKYGFTTGQANQDLLNAEEVKLTDTFSLKKLSKDINLSFSESIFDISPSIPSP